MGEANRHRVEAGRQRGRRELDLTLGLDGDVRQHGLSRARIEHHHRALQESAAADDDGTAASHRIHAGIQEGHLRLGRGLLHQEEGVSVAHLRRHRDAVGGIVGIEPRGAVVHLDRGRTRAGQGRSDAGMEGRGHLHQQSEAAGAGRVGDELHEGGGNSRPGDAGGMEGDRGQDGALGQEAVAAQTDELSAFTLVHDVRRDLRDLRRSGRLVDDDRRRRRHREGREET